MDTDSSFPDTPRYGTEELEGMWPQQTFCQGSDNLQPADCVLHPEYAPNGRNLAFLVPLISGLDRVADTCNVIVGWSRLPLETAKRGANRVG
jgi:hypothetical protein